MAGDFKNLSPYLKDYFDKVVSDTFGSEEEAVKELEQIRFFIEGENAKLKEEFEKQWEGYRNDYHFFHLTMNNLSSEEKIRKLEELDRRREEIETKAKKHGIDLKRYLFDEEQEEPRWNKGEIRSACMNLFENTIVLIDADFEKCREISVEVMLKVSGQDFVIARVRPEENRRFAVIDFIQGNVQYKYRLRWTEGNTIKTSGPYPIKTSSFE